MYEDQERKYRRIGWLTAVGVQVVLLLLFYFLVAWREPFPPLPSYGIELSFGVDNTGFGDQPIRSRETPEETINDPSESEETDQYEDVQPTDEQPVEAADQVTETPVSNVPSPDVVEEKTAVKEPVKPAKEKIEPVKQKPVETPTETKKEPALNPAASMPASAGDATSKGDGTEGGVAGKKEGTIDGRALMGDQGTANGASLQMAGWVWDDKPAPKDNSSESGKIVYKIKIDGDGYIIDIELVSSTVSPSVERYYRQSVERLSFSKTNDYKPAPTSSGTISFIIRSK